MDAEVFPVGTPSNDSHYRISFNERCVFTHRIEPSCPNKKRFNSLLQRNTVLCRELNVSLVVGIPKQCSRTKGRNREVRHPYGDFLAGRWIDGFHAFEFDTSFLFARCETFNFFFLGRLIHVLLNLVVIFEDCFMRKSEFHPLMLRCQYEECTAKKGVRSRREDAYGRAQPHQYIRLLIAREMRLVRLADLGFDAEHIF